MTKRFSWLGVCLLAACSGEEPVGSLAQAGWAANGISPDEFVNAISANPDAMALLRSRSLPAALARPYLRQQLHDPQAVVWMAYLVQCALPAGSQVDLVDGITGQYLGAVEGRHGLAAGWENGAPGLFARERVSACLLARVNYWGSTVALSMRGEPRPLFPISGAEMIAMPIEEGSFYGDLFGVDGITPGVLVKILDDGSLSKTLPGPAPVTIYQEMWACHDVAFDAVDGYLLERVCAVDACVAVPTGSCQSQCALADGAARGGDGDNQECQDASGQVWTMPVTTFLADCNGNDPSLPTCL